MAGGGSQMDFSEQQGEGNEDMSAEHPTGVLQEAGAAAGVTAEDTLDWLVEKNKRERMCEIRSLKLGEKPVTGHNRQETLNNFLASKFEAAEKAASGHNVPSNSQDVQEHRPEAVVVEVSGLFERRPVSSVLQTDSFRRDLERIIRGSVAGVRRATAAAAQAQTSSSSTRTSASSPAPRDVAAASSQRPSRTSSLSSGTSPQPAPTSSSRLPSMTAPPVAPPPPPPAVLPPSNEVQPVGPGIPWLARRPAWHVPTNGTDLSREERQRLAWNSIEQSQRENIISEISELVHQQLVTSSLESEFRGTLELHMQAQLQNTGANGAAVQEFVENIPQSQYIPRNDFSSLGIIPAAPAATGSDFDSASIISATAHQVPYAQTNLAMSREMHALKAQIEELKQMMSLSFNIQCDIQRSIRQEVAAAMNQARQEATAPSVRSVPVDDTHCLICLEATADTVIYSCGHLCLCQKCGYTLQNSGGKCPVCRAPIKDLLRVFKCSPE